MTSVTEIIEDLRIRQRKEVPDREAVIRFSGKE